jgi:hypothetical protein
MGSHPIAVAKGLVSCGCQTPQEQSLAEVGICILSCDFLLLPPTQPTAETNPLGSPTDVLCSMTHYKTRTVIQSQVPGACAHCEPLGSWSVDHHYHYL